MTPLTRGPLGAVVVRLSALAETRPRLLYADLDLAEREATRRALGSGPGGLATDDALVVAAYERWGPAAAEHLGGQFAFALWDGARRVLVAARDPLGLRPLFWAREGDSVTIGGDLRAVLHASGLPDVLDTDLMAGALLDDRLAYPGAVGGTCLRGIHELQGGHRLALGDGAARVERYWWPENVPVQPFRSVGEVGEAMRAALREVIAEAVADAGPGEVGGHLSPGLDASTVLSFTAEALAAAGRPPPHAFTWSHRPDPGAPHPPEFQRMHAVVDRWGLPFTYATAEAEMLTRDALRDATRDAVEAWAPEEPVRQAAHAAGVRLLLSGWGGDEAASFSGRSLTTVHLLKTGRWGPVAAMIARDPLDAARRARGWPRRRRHRLAEPTVAEVRAAALRGELTSYVWPEVLRAATLFEPEPPPLAPRAYAGWLLRRGHIGRRAGAWARAGEPYGLRYRYPLLDRRVLAVALGVPEALWLTRDRRRRWSLRAAGAGLVPDVIRLGPKVEPLHMAHWRQTATAVPGLVAPFVTEAAAADRAALVDVARLRADLDALARDVTAGTVADFRARLKGVHATSYLGLADAHGLGPDAPLPRR